MPRTHDISRTRRTIGRYMDRPDVSPAVETEWTPPEWMERGECGQDQTGRPLWEVYGSELWFMRSKSAETREAKLICQSCPVRTECLAYALERRITDGTWGGLSETEIRGIIRARDIVAKSKRTMSQAETRGYEVGKVRWRSN